MKKTWKTVACFAAFFSFALPVSAQNFSSDSYTVQAPVLYPGGYSTSDTFRLTGVISQMAIGTSTADTFKLFGGFLYFPFVSTPAVTATAGDTQVSLTWTSSDASTGWAVSGYAVGQSAISGGPYTYTDVGNVLSSTRTGLTNGTTYYFVVRVADALGNYIATSTQASATPSGAEEGGGGGGGGGSGAEVTYAAGTANFAGRAYPNSRVVLLKDAEIVGSTVAGPDAKFQISLANLSPGSYLFSLYVVDTSGRKSSTMTFPISLSAGISANVTGIFFTPTIGLDKTEVRKGDNITIFGQSANASEVVVQVNSEVPYFASTKADKDGVYLLRFDSSPLEYGDHSAKSKSAKDNEISSYSPLVGFKVGDRNVLAVRQNMVTKGDGNGDGRVNLVDFSIAAYWYRRSSPPRSADLNGDGKVDLVDFSIIAYNWTG